MATVRDRPARPRHSAALIRNQAKIFRNVQAVAIPQGAHQRALLAPRAPPSPSPRKGALPVYRPGRLQEEPQPQVVAGHLCESPNAMLSRSLPVTLPIGQFADMTGHSRPQRLSRSTPPMRFPSSTASPRRSSPRATCERPSS
jgi:hypothetical protein